MILSQTMDNTDYFAYENNVQISASSWDSTNGTVGTVDSTSAMHLGGRANPTRFYRGFLSELLQYNRVLTSGELLSLDTYLKAKWSIS